MKTELHCHTTLSDGATAMEDLFRFAKLGGIDNLAITDHDTIDGYDQALVYAGQYGIRPVSYTHLDVYKRQGIHFVYRSFFALWMRMFPQTN